jgi:hypothetical protein
MTAAKALAGFSLAGIALDDPIKSLIADLDALADDLRPDLPIVGDPSGDLATGGDAVAMTLRALTNAEALRVRAAIRTNY